MAEQRPVAGREGPGHGCGHNLLGGAALMAAAAVKDYLAENGLAGRVRYYGCPAEEGGAAKAFMVREGLFDDVDVAISWHPGPFNCVEHAVSLANCRIDYTFHGTSAHAAAEPELGRSALDAVELMNIGVNYMREHMPDSARVHYAYLDAGGVAPNVVQSRATVRQLVRAADLEGLHALMARVDKIAEGAALMSGTRVERNVVSGVSNLLGNSVMEQAMQDAFESVGVPTFSDGDIAFAEAIRATVGRDNIVTAFRGEGLKPDMAMPLCDFLMPLERTHGGMNGSTDVGDVSWAVPLVQARVATCAIGTALHSWQMTAQGKSGIAHKGMAVAAKVMAATARALFEAPAKVEAAKAEHAAQLAEAPYVCPMPAETMPPLQPRQTE